MSGAREGKGHASRWEWVAAAISGALVLGLVGVLIGEALAPHVPPILRAAPDSVTSSGAQHLVQFTVHNDGTETAAAVQVEGTLSSGDSVVETSTATVDYVPGRGSGDGGLVFERDPRLHTLRITPRGYQKP